ncbi:helix-turn-helix transcriptional regulator [Leptolyngbyaceae cyanobacterium UHCC 1019]
MSQEVSKVRPGLKALRKKAGLTQIELALQVHVREQAVRAWENGGAVPSFDTAVLIAKALKVSLERLAAEFGLEVDGTPNEEEEAMLN